MRTNDRLVWLGMTQRGSTLYCVVANDVDEAGGEDARLMMAAEGEGLPSTHTQ